MTMVDIFNNLQGEWTLSREIKPGGKMTGIANFNPDGGSKLNYYESGVLTLDDGEQTQAEKRYDYFLKDNETIDVYFADGGTKGELFHRLVYNDNDMAEAEHFCTPDYYSSHYNFSEMPQKIEITHTVLGPKKNYQAKTILTREHA